MYVFTWERNKVLERSGGGNEYDFSVKIFTLRTDERPDVPASKCLPPKGLEIVQGKQNIESG